MHPVSWHTCVRLYIAVLGLLLGCVDVAFSQQPQTPANWDKWAFLLGDWVGEGGGTPGQGSGSFSFTLDLGKRIIVRKNHSEYPATTDRPAYSHDDLMIIYQEPGNPTRAVYFDNEGHVIRYNVEFSNGGSTVIFVSDPTPSAPRYRLTYTKAGAGAVEIKFEIAPPGKPDNFSQYIEARARRK